MIQNILHNRRSAALSLLLATVLFVIVSNIHTDDFTCLENQVRMSGSAAAAAPVIQKANEHSKFHCAACEMLLHGTDNTVVVHFPQVQVAITQRTYADVSQHSFQADYCRQLTSRAPPV